MPRISKAFAEAVNDLMRQHGLSNRGAMLRTGIDYTTINNMRAGMVPRKGVIIDWAMGMNENINYWLEIGGYDPIPPELISECRVIHVVADDRTGHGGDFAAFGKEFELRTVERITFGVPKGTELSKDDEQKIAEIIRLSREPKEA